MGAQIRSGARRSVSRQARRRCAVLVPLFLMIYMEWGDRGSFLFQIPLDMFRDRQGLEAWLHPLVAGPALSLAFLLAAPWWPRVPRVVLLLALALPVLVAGLILLGGVFTAHWRSTLSLLPFLIVLVLLLQSMLRPAR